MAAPISDRLLHAVTFLSPNEHEAAILSGHPISVENGIDYDDVQVVADAFQKRGVKNLRRFCPFFAGNLQARRRRFYRPLA